MPLGSPAVTAGFSDYLSTKWQKVLVNVGKMVPPLYTMAEMVTDMEVNPSLAVKISGLGQMPAKPEGTQFFFDQPIPGGNYTITAVPFGMGFSVTFEMWRDDLYGVMMDMWMHMGKSCRYRQEVVGWAPWNNAFSVATGYDATDLCSTSHPDLDGTVQSNRPSPDVTISQTAIQAGLLNYALLNDDRSLPQSVYPSRLIYHPTNIWLVRELLGSSGKPQNADNDANALLPEELTGLPSRYLTRTQDWFLCAPVSQTDIKFRWRDRPMPRNFDDPFTMDADFTLYQRMTTDVGDWRGVYGSSTGV